MANIRNWVKNVFTKQQINDASLLDYLIRMIGNPAQAGQNPNIYDLLLSSEVSVSGLNTGRVSITTSVTIPVATPYVIVPTFAYLQVNVQVLAASTTVVTAQASTNNGTTWGNIVVYAGAAPNTSVANITNPTAGLLFFVREEYSQLRIATSASPVTVSVELVARQGYMG